MKKGIRTVLEISPQHIKLIQAKTIRQKEYLCACDVRPVVQGTDDELNKILTEIALNKSIASELFTVAIARKNIIIKQLRLPSVNDAEIKKMIELQLVSKIPYSIEEVIFDHYVLEKEEGGYTRVCVIVVHRNICEQYLKVLNTIGIPIGKITFSSAGILQWWREYQKRKKINITAPVMIINVDDQFSELCFVNNGHLYFSRSIGRGARDLTEHHLVAMSEEVQLSMYSYSKDKLGPGIEKIILVSNITEVHSLKEHLESALKVPVDLVNPLEGILCQKNINLTSFKDQSRISFAVGLGLLAQSGKDAVNLTPKEVHQTKETKEKRSELIKFIILFTVTCLLGVSVLGIKLYRKTMILNSLESRLKKNDPFIGEVRRKMDFLQFYKDEFENRVFIPDLINELNALVPEEISFRSLVLDGNGRFTIQGYAQTGNSVNNFQANLVKSKVFSEVNLQFATKRKIFNTDVTDFKITSELINNRK